MLKSIVSIYKDRALPDVLREIYDNGMQLYIFLENSDNPFNLFSSGLWPVPKKITWELLHVMGDEDADCVRLRIIHPTDTIEFGPHRQFIALDSLRESDKQKFLSDVALQSLLRKIPDACQVLKIKQITAVEDLIRLARLPSEEAYSIYEKELLKKFIDPFRQLTSLCIVTTVTVSAKKLFVYGNSPGMLLRYSNQLSSRLEQEYPGWRTWSGGKKRIEKLVDEWYPELKPEWKRIVIAAVTQGEFCTRGEAEDHSEDILERNT